MNAQLDWLTADRFADLRRSIIDVPRAANADPSTSHLAAERIKASGALGEQQQRVLECAQAHPGCTSAELADFEARADRGDYAYLRTMFGRRLPEVALLHIRRGDARVCRKTGAKCVTWWPR